MGQAIRNRLNWVLTPQPEPSGDDCLILPELKSIEKWAQNPVIKNRTAYRNHNNGQEHRSKKDATSLAHLKKAHLKQADLKTVEIKELTTDPGVAQALLAYHWTSPKPHLPSWQALRPTLVRRLGDSTCYTQVNFALAGAQACWRSQNRLGGILELLCNHLPRKAPLTVFHQLALQSIQAFFPFLRSISQDEKDQRSAPAKSGWNLSRLIPWNIPQAPALDSYWQRVWELGQLLAEDWEIPGNWEKEATYFSSFENAWPLIRELNIPASARVLDELIEERDRLLTIAAPTQVWKPLELRCTITGIRLGSELADASAPLPQSKKMDLQLVKTLVREELAEMAAGAGHEINNPLGILTGAIQKLHKDLVKIAGESEGTPNAKGASPSTGPSLAEALSPSLDLMKRQVQRVRSQIESLMVFARPPEPRPKLVSAKECLELWEKEALSLGLLAQSEEAGKVRAGKARRPKAQSKVAIQEDKHPLLANIDKDLFARAGQWMLEFASSQLTPERSREVRLGRQLKAGALIFEMQYHQVAPRPSQILHLFTPFFCPKGYGRSSGLQLAASRAILEKMGAKIGLVPAPTPGWTLMRVRVPLAAKAPGKPRSASSKAA